jgi:hypothetical protein
MPTQPAQTINDLPQIRKNRESDSSNLAVWEEALLAEREIT